MRKPLYPLVFSDTGAFLAQTLPAWWSGTSPMSSGRCCTPSTGGSACGCRRSRRGCCCPGWSGWRSACCGAGRRPGGRCRWHLLLCAGLAALTTAPWFTALLDAGHPGAGAGARDVPARLRREAAGAGRAMRARAGGQLAAAAHLSHLPVAAALLLPVALLRGTGGRCWPPPRRCWLRCCCWSARIAAGHGRLALSPYGAVFALARLVADGPAARTIEARCPEAGWHLCRWAGRLPADGRIPVVARWPCLGAAAGDDAIPRGPISLAPEAAAILRETLAREPWSVAGAAAAKHRAATAHGANRRHAGA